MLNYAFAFLIAFSSFTAAATEAGHCLTCGRKKNPTAVEGRCPSLEPLIGTMAPGQVACYSSLFFHESTCSATVVHDQKKNHNPYPAVGLCALESSPDIRRKQKRGPDCVSIGTAAEQVRCCIAIMRKTNGHYFGTVNSGKTPRCG